MVVRLVDGDDAVLVSETLTELVDGLVGDGDRGLMVEQLTEVDLRRPDDDEWDTSRLVDAARTPPFLTDRRVVVGRHLQRFSSKESYGPLIALVADHLPTTDLILIWEPGVDPKPDKRVALPKALKEAVEVAGGELVSATAGSGKSGTAWLRDRLEMSTLSFDPAAVTAVEDLVGEERSRVVGLLRTLEGALGEGAEVTADDICTFGGEAGTVVPWELDDAIDRGDIAAALDVLRRQLTGRHPFQLLAALHQRYQRMLRLDGADAADEKAAAALLGMKGSTFPARKLLAQTRKLGSERIARAVRLLADADLQLRGTVDWPEELVMEVLVARLAALTPQPARR